MFAYVLRFFRSIRRALLNEGKTAQYLKYATGEFILVVLGILVALQINTWNEERKLRLDRQELITNLKAEFELNEKQLEEIIAAADEISSSIAELLLVSAGESDQQFSYDELKDLAFNLFKNAAFAPTLGYYRSSVSTGAIYLLGETSILNTIALFEENLRRFVALETLAREDYFLGNMVDVRKEYGAMESLFRHSQSAPSITFSTPVPEIYALTETEYRELISQKEMYAIFAHRLELRIRIGNRLKSMRDICGEIASALSELN